jgi:hypothetical protein
MGMLRWVFGIFSVMIFLNIVCIVPVFAQWISVPLPSSILPKSQNCCNESIYNATSSNNTMVSLLTKSLHEGNNIVKFKIVNEHPIIFKSLQYTSGNSTLTTYLAKSLNDEYRALIKVHAPQTKITVVTSIDGCHSQHFDKILKVQNYDLWFEFIQNLKSLFKW